MAWIGQLVERGRRSWPERVAVIDGDREVTYAQLEDRTARLARGLVRHGIGLGDRVAVLSRNRLEVLESYLALGRMGGVAVPVNHTLVGREIAHVWERTRPVAVLGEAALLDGLPAGGGAEALAFEEATYRAWADAGERGPLPELGPEDLFAIIHTSATTGLPKGVVYNHRMLRALATGYLTDVPPDLDMIFLNCFQLCHGALVQPLINMVRGATIVVQPGFTPQGCLEELERTRATHLWLVPEMLKFILRSRKLDSTDLSSLREIHYAAAPMPPQVLQEGARRLGCGFREIYGMTEGGGPMATIGPAEHVAALERMGEESVLPAGRPICGVGMRVFSESGAVLPEGEIGEICVNGDGVMPGYWEDPEATTSVLRESWLRTGDLGWMGADGYVHLAGRLKEMIMRSGQQVFPAEVEQALLRHPAVAEAGVIGLPDPDYGETPVAFVVVRDGFTDPGEIQGFLVDHLASYKRPSRIELVAELPRNQTGKLLRRVLRERALAEVLVS